MYKLTTEAKNAFMNETKHAELMFTGTGESIAIAPNRLKSLQFTRSSASGDTIAIGEANASTLTLELDNDDGYFKGVKFSGGTIFCRLYAGTHSLPVGYFIVAEAPRKNGVITVDCYDRMVLFDKVADLSGLSFPASIEALTAYICRKCAVPLSSTVDFTKLPNGGYTVQNKPEESDSLTYRNILMWVCEITACNAYMDWDGALRLAFYAETGERITSAERYSHDLSEVDNTITGVNIEAGDETYLAGTNDYAFNITGNELIQTGARTVANNIFGAVGGFTYRPFTAETVAMPWLYPLDVVSYIEKDGTTHSAIITNTEYKMNGKQTTTGVGDNALETELTQFGGLSAREMAILKSAQERVERELTTREQALISLNETIANALGVYSFETVHPDGSKSFYFGNAATLEASSYIFTMNGGGFAWTNEWRGTETVWNYGIDKNGNAVLNYLSAHKLSADYIDVGTIEVTKSININNNFIVDEYGNARMNGSVVFGTGTAPTQAVYNRTDATPPPNGTAYSDFPDNYDTEQLNGWHKKYDDENDYFGSYTYDGGATWTEPIQIRGVDGLPGKDGEKGQDGQNGKDGKDGADGAPGKDGTNGQDGDTVQVVYLYYKSASTTPPSKPVYSGGQNPPTGWSFEPTTLTASIRYEFISKCTVTNGNYGTWSVPVLWTRFATDGKNGSDGKDGSDATVNEVNVFNALTQSGTKFGCFYAQDGKLYINASYMKTGTIDSSLVFTDDMVASKGTIGGFTINATSLYNGVTSITDTAHDGVYVGTDGIRLGKGGTFNVDTAGAVTAANVTLKGSNADTTITSNGLKVLSKSLSNSSCEVSGAGVYTTNLLNPMVFGVTTGISTSTVWGNVTGLHIAKDGHITLANNTQGKGIDILAESGSVTIGSANSPLILAVNSGAAYVSNSYVYVGSSYVTVWKSEYAGHNALVFIQGSGTNKNMAIFAIGNVDRDSQTGKKFIENVGYVNVNGYINKRWNYEDFQISMSNSNAYGNYSVTVISTL